MANILYAEANSNSVQPIIIKEQGPIIEQKPLAQEEAQEIINTAHPSPIHEPHFEYKRLDVNKIPWYTQTVYDHNRVRVDPER